MASEADELRAEVARLERELRQVTAGSAWKDAIAKFLLEAEVNDKLQDLIDDQVQKRMEDLVRTEEAWCDLNLALEKAGLRLRVRDGRVFVAEDARGAEELPLEDLLAVRPTRN